MSFESEVFASQLQQFEQAAREASHRLFESTGSERHEQANQPMSPKNHQVEQMLNGFELREGETQLAGRTTVKCPDGSTAPSSAKNCMDAKAS